MMNAGDPGAYGLGGRVPSLEHGPGRQIAFELQQRDIAVGMAAPPKAESRPAPSVRGTLRKSGRSPLQVRVWYDQSAVTLRASSSVATQWAAVRK